MIKEKENKENAKLNSFLLTEGNYAKVSSKKWEKLINKKNEIIQLLIILIVLEIKLNCYN